MEILRPRPHRLVIVRYGPVEILHHPVTGSPAVAGPGVLRVKSQSRVEVCYRRVVSSPEPVAVPSATVVLVLGEGSVPALSFAVQCGELGLAEAKIEGRDLKELIVGDKCQALIEAHPDGGVQALGDVGRR